MLGRVTKITGQTTRSTQRDLVGCFGKIPLQAAFDKYNVYGHEVLTLRHWVHEGIVMMNRKYGDKWPDKLAHMPRYRFSWVGDKQDRTLAGIIGPGVGRSGHDYPFVVFSSMDHALFKIRQASVPMARAEFFDTLFSISAKDWRGLKMSALNSTLNTASQACRKVDDNDMLDMEMSMLGSITMKEFWDQIFPAADVNTRAKFVCTVVSALYTVLRRTPQRVHWGIRLPLPRNTDQTAHVVFWIQFCESVLQGRPWHGQYFWNEQEHDFPARLTVFFRPIPASYFSTLIEQQINDGFVLDVLNEMENDVSDISNVRHVVDKDDMLLVDAIERWRSHEFVQRLAARLW